jgi:hypothetical protein
VDRRCGRGLTQLWVPRQPRARTYIDDIQGFMLVGAYIDDIQGFMIVGASALESQNPQAPFKIATRCGRLAVTKSLREILLQS